MGTAQRLAQLPDVPTVAEMGYKDFETSQWYGILAPAGTPRDVVIKLQEESLKALKSNAVTERFASDSAVGGGGPPAEFAAFIAQQQKVWKEIVQRANIKRTDRQTQCKQAACGAEARRPRQAACPCAYAGPARAEMPAAQDRCRHGLRRLLPGYCRRVSQSRTCLSASSWLMP